MRRIFRLVLCNIIVAYFAFQAGLFTVSMLVLGGVEFDSLEGLNESVVRTIWYVDFIVCPLIAVGIGVLTSLFVRSRAWAIAAVSTIPLAAYLHIADFPRMKIMVIDEVLRGGRYIVIATVAALVVARIKQRIEEWGKAENSGLPPVPPEL